MNTSNANELMKYLTIFFRFLFVMVNVMLCIVLLYYVLKYAYPFVAAFILAIMLNPFIHWIQAYTKFPRSISILVVMVFGMGIIFGVVSLISVEIMNGLSFLLAQLPDQIKTMTQLLGTSIYDHILPSWEKITRQFYALDSAQQSAVLNNIKELNHEAASFVTKIGTRFLSYLTNFIVRLPSTITILIVIFLATFFICKDWYRISNYLKQKMEKRIHTAFIQVFREFKEAVSGYFRAQFALMSITCAVMMVALSILRVHHAFTISLLTAMVDFLPYLGTGAVLLPWSLYSFLTGQPRFALYILSLYLILVIIRQILEPKMLAASIGLNPLATLISVYVGFKVFGLMGLLIGPGSLVLIKSLNHAEVFKTAWKFIISASK